MLSVITSRHVRTAEHLDEARRLVRLAVPAMLTGIGFVALGTVDTIVVGRLGPTSLAGVALANSVYFSLCCLMVGFLDAITPLVAQRRGAGDAAGTRDVLWQGLWLALVTGGALALLSGLAVAGLPWLAGDPEVAALAGTYLGIRAWSAPAAAVGHVLRAYLYGMGDTVSVTRVVLTANTVNAVVDVAMVFGVPSLGIPGLGVTGAAAATVFAELLITGLLVLRLRTGRAEQDLLPVRRPSATGAREIASLGWPLGLQFFLETSVFSCVAVLAGRIGAVALSAHQVSLSLAALAFVTVNGFARAASIRVGRHVGARDPVGARRAGLVALGLSCVPMAVMTAAFVGIPGRLAGLYSTDPEVVSLATELLGIAAVFHVVDGLQVVAAACLKGAGDTRTPLLATLVGFWILGVPVGWWLAFPGGLGIHGLWWGLTVSLAVVAGALGLRFGRLRLAPAAAVSRGATRA